MKLAQDAILSTIDQHRDEAVPTEVSEELIAELIKRGAGHLTLPDCKAFLGALHAIVGQRKG